MNTLNLGDQKIVNYCDSFIKVFLTNKGYVIEHLENISRLTWKNIVYKAILKNFEIFSIKLILNCNDAERRFNSEAKASSYFKKGNIKSFSFCDYDEKVIVNDNIIYAVLVRKWVSGISYMQILKSNFDEFSNVCLPTIKCCCEEVWKLDNQNLPRTTSNIKRYILDSFSLFEKCYGDSQIGVFLFEAYNKNMPTDNNFCFINSDFSLHEFIITETGKVNIIDWEDISFGSKIVDVAGIYYSIFQYIAQIFNFKEIMKFTQYYITLFELDNINDFIYYFIERIVMADYLTRSVNKDVLRFSPKIINALIGDVK